MVRSNLSVHGGNHGDEEAPIARAELCQRASSLFEVLANSLFEVHDINKKIITEKNMVIKILVLVMDFMTVSAMVVVMDRC